MHYFQFEIKEWVSNTAHLTLEEEAAYLRLIFFYYDSERPIDSSDLDRVFRRCRIPKDLGCYILSEFFQCEGDTLWVHKRCDREIEKYHAKHEQASRAGKASAESRLNARSSTAQPIKNQESSIINQESKNQKSNTTPVVKPDGVTDSVWQDYLSLRKAKRATLSATALKGIIREGNKAGIPLDDVLRICCERGWAGFKADWITNHIDKMPIRGTDKNLAAARAIFGDERRLTQPAVIEEGFINDRKPKQIT